MDWTQLLKELREAGVSQEDVASAVGITQSSVSDLARGKTKQPSYDVGEKLRRLHARKGRPLVEPTTKAA